GYRALVSSSAPDAMALLEQERVAGILLDLVLDEGEDSGFALRTWIRGRQHGLPVIVLSAAQVNSAAIRKAYELGASSYFVKGNVPMAHIYSDLAARLIERGTGRPGTYNFGRVEFDPTRRTVRTETAQVRLTPQQTALVLHLAQGSKPATARDLIEALPILEESGVEFQSESEGHMHACGHDSHIAMMLGTARTLVDHIWDLNGRFLFVFQPAEEIVSGAKAMIAGGLLKSHHPDAVIGLHIASFIDSGTIVTKPGLM